MEKYGPQRQRLIRDTAKVKRWHKLYKSGTHWIVATIGTATLGLVLLSTTASADEVPTEVATNTSVVAGTTSVPNEVVIQTSSTPATSDAVPPVTETQSTPTGEPTTTSSQIETATMQPTTTDTPTANNVVSIPMASQALDSVASSDTGSSATDESSEAVTQAKTATQAPQPTPVTQVADNNAKSISAVSTGSSTKVASTDTETPVATVAAAQPSAVNMAVADTAIPTTTLTNLAAPTVPTFVVPAPITNNSDITPNAKFPQNYGITAISEPNDKYIYTQQADGTWVATSLGTTFNQPWSKPSYNIMATNTREINGVQYLTTKSVLTFNVTTQPLQLPFTVDVMPPTPYVWINATLVTGDTVKLGTTESIFTTGNWSSPNQTATLTTINGRLNNPITGTLGVADSGISDEGAIAWLTFRSADQTQYRLLLGYLATQTFQLAPVITSWQAGSPVMTGTGVGAENTITIYKADGTVLTRTAVDDQGQWAVNLNNVDQSQPLYVVESNDLGDLPGVTTVTQYATATRNVIFLDEETGDLLSPTVPQTLPVLNESRATITSTGQVTWVNGEWQPTVPNGEFSAVPLPVIPGYYATVDAVPVESFEALDPTDITKPIETLIHYNRLASWVSSEPGMAPIAYLNDPNNASGALDSNSPDAPVAPFVAGKTPQGPDGTLLTLKNPDDSSQGYRLPMPTDLGTPTLIQYVADTQHGTVTYQDVQDVAHPATIGLVDSLSGDSDSTSSYTTAARIAELVSQGYVLVNDDFPADGLVFDQDTTKDQAYVVTFNHGTATITPDDSGVPGQLVDPSNPDGPKWPANSDDVTTLKVAVTQTIDFVEAGTGNPLVASYVDELTFERSATVDLVTGTITPAIDWMAMSKNTDNTPDTTFDEVPSPWLSGYIADKKTIAAKPGIQATDADIVETVTYSKVSAWTPTDPNLPPIPYVVDPNNPNTLLPTTDSKTPVIPNRPGKTPNGPDGQPLTPVDSNNLDAGFIPPTPVDPTQPTLIDYVADTQKATVTYQDIQVAAKPVTLDEIDELSGDSETASSYTTAERIKALISQGYVLVNDGFPAAGLIFDTDTGVDQNYIVTVTHGKAVITAEAPGKPGEPIDADHPEGPIWPAGSDNVADLTKTITQTVNYLIAGTTTNAAQPHTDTMSFQQSANVDLVTGKMTPNDDWTVTTKHDDGTDDTTFDAVISPALAGYIVDRPTVDEITDVTQNSADVVETVTYAKVGAWTPTDPELPAITYVVDPEKPNELLSTTDPKTPVIPNIAGKTPYGPDGKPLTPVDSANSAAGFIPPTPVDPTQPTAIEYVADEQRGTVTYQDVADSAHPITLGVDELNGVSETTSPYTTANRITELVAKGYVLVADDFPATGLVFDTDASVDQAYVVTFVHGEATVTAEKPGRPGEPIDADKPTGPKWPTGSDNVADLSHTVTETIAYVAINGQSLAPDFSDSITFTRAGQVDLVNGIVTPAVNWQVPDDTTFDAVTSPVITGYFTSQPVVAAVTGITPDSTAIVEQVVYQKLGYWVIPELGIDPVPYPNDPDRSNGVLSPTDPQAPVIPYVPGKTPQSPNGELLTPKNANDLTQGYVPPALVQLDQDTTITYVPNSDTDPDTDGQTPPNPGTGGETDTDPDTGGETPPNPGTGGETDTNPDTGGQTPPNPGTGDSTDTNPYTDSETPPTPEIDNGTSTTPDTGNGTTPTPDISGDVSVTPDNGGDNAMTLNPEVDSETPSVGTTLAPENETPQLAAPIQIETANPTTNSVKRPSGPSVIPVTATTAVSTEAKPQTNGNLPQTDESTNVLAVLGLSLLGLMGLGRFARRRNQR